MSEIRKRARDEITGRQPTYVQTSLNQLHTTLQDNFIHSLALKPECISSDIKRFPAFLNPERTSILLDPGGQTKNGDNFVLANDETHDRIILLGTVANLRLLCKPDKIFCDGTFYISPEQFTHICSIHAFVNGHMFHLVFGLLPNKTRAAYARMFRLLKDATEQNDPTLDPQVNQLDFEAVVHSAKM